LIFPKNLGQLSLHCPNLVIPLNSTIITTFPPLVMIYLLIPATEWGGDYKNAHRPSVRPSVRNISCLLYNLRTHRWITLTRIHTSKVKVTQYI